MEYQQQLPTNLGKKRDFAIYNLAKGNETRLFFQYLKELSRIIKEPKPKSKNGRPPIPLKDMFFASCLKLYRKSSGRPLKGELELARDARYISRVPHFNTLKDFFNSEGTYDLLSKMLTITAIPLAEADKNTYSTDSSGFGGNQYERWQRIKLDKHKDKKNYLKAHLTVGVKTHVIIAAEITPGNFSDVNQAPRLILQAKENFSIKKFCGDKAYSSKLVYRILESLKIIPLIPFQTRINKPSKDAPKLWNDSLKYFRENRYQFEQEYHQRSQSETVFSQIKTRLGEILLSKNYKSQRNELMLKLICHNVLTLIMELHRRKIAIDFTSANVKFKQPVIPKEFSRMDGSDVENEDF